MGLLCVTEVPQITLTSSEIQVRILALAPIMSQIKIMLHSEIYFNCSVSIDFQCYVYYDPKKKMLS